MVNKFIDILIFCFVMTITQSCESDSVNSDNYKLYCNNEENGLIQKRTFENIIYSLKYEPIELKVINELKAEKKTWSTNNFNTLKSKYNGLLYFVFKIENSNSVKSPIKTLAKSEEELAKINQYCQSKLLNDFYLESGDIKIPAVLFHIEDDYNLTNYTLISLAFENKIPEKDIVFVYNDPFFNNGLIKFHISKESIKDIPNIKI